MQNLIDTRKYRYIGRPGRHCGLYGKICHGVLRKRDKKRVWAGGPGPRNALVWFPDLGMVVVLSRTLRRIK